MQESNRYAHCSLIIHRYILGLINIYPIVVIKCGIHFLISLIYLSQVNIGMSCLNIEISQP